MELVKITFDDNSLAGRKAVKSFSVTQFAKNKTLLQFTFSAQNYLNLL